MVLVVDMEDSELAPLSHANLEHLLGISQIRKADYHLDHVGPKTD
jgi:hypothetical protein